MADCFIIMPLSTPDSVASRYRDDSDHFLHVLDHLFVPAVEKAGLKAVKPIASGSDLIHAEIIRQLEIADLVLCDMSTLNPNVFFELGIRTALNLPVSLVTDDRTANVPFDTGVINYHKYDSSLMPWILDKQINALGAHVVTSLNRSDGQNSMWKYFGLTTRAHKAAGEVQQEDKLDFIIDLLQVDRQEPEQRIRRPQSNAGQEEVREWILSRANELASEVGAAFTVVEAGASEMVLSLGRSVLPGRIARRVQDLGGEYGLTIRIEGEVYN